jgi:hypothetical protein
MKISNKTFLFVATSICFAQTSVHAGEKNVSRILKAAAALAALGTAGTGIYNFPEAAATFAIGGSAGILVSAGAYHAGRLAGYIYDDRSSRCFIGGTGALGLGVAAAFHNYIPTTPAADVGYVLTCGTLASLPMAEVADLVGIGSWR